MNYRPAFVLLLISISCHTYAQQISQWRGINRDGMYNETQLLKTWPAEGPALLWTNETIGDGYGSPVVTADMLFINGEIDSISHLFAFDLSGKLLWKSPNGREFTGQGYSNKFPGARSTPTIVNNLIYVCSGNGRIACFEKQTGKEKWAVQMLSDMNGHMNSFGYSESLALDANNVYCFPGGVTNNVVALNRLTGKTVWTSKALGDTVSYCSPVIINLAARSVLVTFTVHYIMGLDTKTGELLWSQKQENVKYQQQCNTPIYADGFIYYVAGDGNGAVKLELSIDGKSIKEVWRNSPLSNNFSGFLKINDYLFSTERSQKLKCLDVKSGKTIDSLRINKGAIISADGMLYTYSENGEVNLIKTTGSKMESVGKFKIEKGTREHFAHPVISKGVLYIRHGKILMAYNIKQV
jgi:outer membrane protein assembly factor BamB